MFTFCKIWIRRLVLGIAVAVVSGGSAHAAEAAKLIVGEAYWGSFGERSGRIEGVVLKTGDKGVFIGFDEESDVAAFSFEVDWSSEERFSLEGFSRSGSSAISQPTRGTGRSISSSEGPLLESSLEALDLRFEAFEKGQARLAHYRLEGAIGGELIVAVGDTARSFALFLGDDGFAYGGPTRMEEGSSILFETNRGDRFEGSSPDALSTYTLSSGEKGRIAPVNSESENGQAVGLRSIWSYCEKREGFMSDGLHLILAGSGSVEVDFEASIRFDIRDGYQMKDLELAEVEVLRLVEDGEWRSFLRSGPLIRTKTGGADEFGIGFSRSLPTILREGTYLAELTGIDSFRGIVELSASIAPAVDIAAVNGSVLYARLGDSAEHRLGFELEGEGVIPSLIRNVGPGLSYFDMEDGTEDPEMSIFRSGRKMWKNDDWEDSLSPLAIKERGKDVGAFPLPANSSDAALALFLGEGRYEVVARTNASQYGFEILEMYCRPQRTPDAFASDTQ